MCLIPLKTRKFLFWTLPVIEKAKEDITVYKMLLSDNTGPYNSSYNSSYKYQNGYNFPENKDCIKLYKTKYNRKGLVGIGWLHAFTTLEIAYTNLMFMWFKSGLKIVEMTIPKGTKYIIGNGQICAKCLKW